MSLDIIKKYLVSIGFKADDNSFKKTEDKIKETSDKIKESAKDNKQSFNDTFSGLKELYGLLEKTPVLKSLIPHGNSDLQKIFTAMKTLKNGNEEDIISKLFPKEKTEVVKKSIDSLKEHFSKFSNKSVGDILKFAGKATVAIAATVAILKILKEVITGTIDLLDDLANKNIEYEKVARQLWTTKENAREVTKALDTMGVSMQDLWLSPTLLDQFNKLRKDSSALQLPKEYQEGLKTIQGIGLEWKRTKQLGSIALEWIGNAILKYCKGPLENINRLLHSGNDWLLKAIPKIASLIGSGLGAILKFVLSIVEGILYIGKGIGNTLKFISDIGEKIPKPVKDVLEFIKKIFFMIGLIASPVLGLILLVEDFFGFLEGKKSVIGTLFEEIKKKAKETFGDFNIDSVIDKVKEKIDNLLEGTKLGDIVSDISNVINSSLQEIDDFINSICNKLDTLNIPDNLKFWKKPNNELGDNNDSSFNSSFSIFEIIGGLKSKMKINSLIPPGVGSGVGAIKDIYDSFKEPNIPGYLPGSTTTNSSTSTADNSKTNSDNIVTNYNNITVSGSDPRANASSIDNRLSSINIRSLGGMFGG